eukprot:scaffold1540_cov194-Alexandrium_tamarense.AAC.2
MKDAIVCPLIGFLTLFNAISGHNYWTLTLETRAGLVGVERWYNVLLACKCALPSSSLNKW